MVIQCCAGNSRRSWLIFHLAVECSYKRIILWVSKHTINKQTNQQTNERANKHTNKQISKTNKNKETCRRRNEQTVKHTNKHTKKQHQTKRQRSNPNRTGAWHHHVIMTHHHVIMTIKSSDTLIPLIWRCPKMGVPPNHSLLDGIFPNKNHPAIGVPYNCGNTHIIKWWFL